MNKVKTLKTFLFPGQGSQVVGMCKYLLEDPKERTWASSLIKEFSDVLKKDIQKLMLSGPVEELNMTQNAQPAIFINSYLQFLKYQRNNNIEDGDFTYALGNSVGEYSALVAAKSLDPFATARLLQKRGELMQKACSGKDCGMLAVLSSDMTILNKVIQNSKQFILEQQGKEQVCQIAVFASNKQTILSGESLPLKMIQQELKKSCKISSVFLQVSAAFHCSLLSSIKGEFHNELKSISIADPNLIIHRNIDLQVYQGQNDIIEGLVNQLDQPILFRQGIEQIIDTATQNQQSLEFIELGTTGLLSKLVRDISASKLSKSDMPTLTNVY